MAVATDTQAAVGSDQTTVTSLTTAGFSPAGTNRLIVACVVNQDGTTSPVLCRYGGSGGTDMDALGTIGADAFNLGRVSMFRKVPGPSGSTTGYASIGNSEFMAAAFVTLTGVDQTTPFDAEVKGPNNVFENGTTKPVSLVLSGLDPGQFVLGFLGYIDVGGAGIASISMGANTTSIVQELATGAASGNQTASVAAFYGTADGSGNLTFNVDVTTSGAAFSHWQIVAYPVNAAAGGGGVSIGPLVRNSNQLIGAENAT